MLVTVRTWLVGRVEELRNNSSTSFAVIDLALPRLLDYAKMVGLREGVAGDAQAVEQALLHPNVLGLAPPKPVAPRPEDAAGGGYPTLARWASLAERQHAW